MGDFQFNVIESKKGLPVIEVVVDGKKLLLHSKYDPIKEAARFIDSCKERIEKADHILFYGGGMGYHLKVFFEKYPDKIASVYEPFQQIYKISNQNVEKTNYPISLLQYYVVRTREKISPQDLEVFSNLNQKIEIIVLPSYGEWQKAQFQDFIHAFKKVIDVKKGNIASELFFSRRWTINALMNLPKTMQHPNFLVEKKAFFKGKPAIIVSAGPSLSEEIENLRYIKENGLAYIFSAGSAYKALIKENLYPDAVCTYDPQNHNYLIFKELVENQIDSIPMIYGTTVGFETLEYYKGPKLYFPVSQEQLTVQFHKDSQIIISDATTIANVILQLFNILEVSKVILVGQNFAFKNNYFYAEGIKRYDEKKGQESDNRVFEKDLQLTFEVEDVHGGKVLTNDSFRRMKNDMENYLSIMKIPVINTTNGGAAIKGTIYKPLKNVIEEDLTERVVDDNWWKDTNANREVLNKSFLKKYSEAFEIFEELNDKLQAFLNEFEKELPILKEYQIQKKLEQFDNLFQKYHRNIFYKTTILPTARTSFEKLKIENELIIATTNLKQKSEKVIKVYTNYIQQCLKIYLELAPIVCYYTLTKLKELAGAKRYEAASGVFHYEGKWNNKFPPEKERMPESLTEEEKKEWYKRKRLEDKIDIPIPIFVETTQNGAKIKFRFKGTKIALFGFNSSFDDIVLNVQIDQNNKIVTLPGIQGDKYIRKNFYSAAHLKNIMHDVTIEILSDNPHFLFDGIEIDPAGRAYHIHEVEQVEELEIGKRIRCHYKATYNTVGEFSGLGKESSNFLPVNPCPEPNGDFYFIMVDEIDGEKILVADRDLQNYISWVTLNDYGLGDTKSYKLIPTLGDHIYMSLLTGGNDENDIENDWNKYIISSNLNNTIQPNDDFVWNWSSKSGVWTNTLSNSYSPNGVLLKPVRGKLFVNNKWYGNDASRWVLSTTINILEYVSFRAKIKILKEK